MQVCQFDIHRHLCLDFDVETLKFLIICKSLRVINIARKELIRKVDSRIINDQLSLDSYHGITLCHISARVAHVSSLMHQLEL